MLGYQLAMTKKIVRSLQQHDNVLISLVFMTNSTDPQTGAPLPGPEVDWGLKIAAAVREVDPARLIVVPTQWIAQFEKEGSCADVMLANCGAGSSCPGGLPPATGGGFRPLPPAQTSGLRPSILDSSGDSSRGVAAYRDVYWSWATNGGGVIYNLDWSFCARGYEAGTMHDPQVDKTPSSNQCLLWGISPYAYTLHL
jgi:hypothetical protein